VLFDVGPEHVEQEGEQGRHADPSLKLPSGHTAPELVTDCIASHFVRSLASWVKPYLSVTQLPLPSAHCWQPSPQTAQLPFPSGKNPGAPICGAKPIGLATLLCAHTAGAYPLVITDLGAGRLAFAELLLSSSASSSSAGSPRVRTLLVAREEARGSRCADRRCDGRH